MCGCAAAHEGALRATQSILQPSLGSTCNCFNPLDSITTPRARGTQEGRRCKHGPRSRLGEFIECDTALAQNAQQAVAPTFRFMEERHAAFRACFSTTAGTSSFDFVGWLRCWRLQSPVRWLLHSASAQLPSRSEPTAVPPRAPAGCPSSNSALYALLGLRHRAARTATVATSGRRLNPAPGLLVDSESCHCSAFVYLCDG